MNNKIQFKVLLWRNLLYKKRHKVSSLIEIIVPVVILLIICNIYINIYFILYSFIFPSSNYIEA